MANKVQLIPDNWTWDEYVEFVAHYNAKNLDAAYAVARKLIISWDYPVDLASEDPIGQLKVKESFELLRSIFATIGKFLEDLDVKGIVVDDNAWTQRDLANYDKARAMENWRKAEDMVRAITKWDVLDTCPVGEPLPFPVAARVYQAVQNMVAKVASGKN